MKVLAEFESLQFEIWIADLNPRFGMEAEKQNRCNCSNRFADSIYASTIICPITTNVKPDAKILRVHIPKGSAKVKEDCDVMINQIRGIDNKIIKKNWRT